MSEDKKKKARPEIDVDFGFGGLFKGIGNFIDLLSEMVEEGEEEVSRTGEFKIKDLGERGRGVYGFNIKMGIGGMPQVEHFGNIRETEEGPVVADEREPLVDVFDEGDVILVVAELPGVAEEEIKIEIKDDILSLETTGERRFTKEILLPCPVNPATTKKAYKNAMLELWVEKAGGS